MRAALIELGFVDCYHMFSIIEENPKDADLWVEAFEAKFQGKGKLWGREEFDQVLGHCMVFSFPTTLKIWAHIFKAVTDWPCATFVDELIAAYPDAKVILTVRDNVEVWHKSVTETLWTGHFVFAPPETSFQAFIQKIIPKPEGFLMPKMLYKHTLLKNHPEEGREGYLKHNEHVSAVAPKGRFLEFNVRDGWRPLCKFLEVEIPEGLFPKVNDTETWKAYVRKSKKDAALKLVGSVLMALGCIGSVGVAYWLVLGR